jgi:dTDP-4-amino-4,6-dideoxygalactose transaminase
VGSCRFSDAAVFSFHPVKIITTGEGGMVVTNDDDLAARVRLLRTHGVTRDESAMKGACEGAWYYQQIALGFNYRMTDIPRRWVRARYASDEFVSRHNAMAEASVTFEGLSLKWQTVAGRGLRTTCS